METSREDFGIAIRSAFLAKGTKQRFSLFVLIILAIIFLFVETIETKPLNYLRSFIKDTIYRGSLVVSLPSKSFSSVTNIISKHINVYSNYSELKKAGFKICLVSPELQQHPLDRISEFKKQIISLEIDAVCTKRPDLWQ